MASLYDIESINIEMVLNVTVKLRAYICCKCSLLYKLNILTYSVISVLPKI